MKMKIKKGTRVIAYNGEAGEVIGTSNSYGVFGYIVQHDNGCLEEYRLDQLKIEK